MFLRCSRKFIPPFSCSNREINFPVFAEVGKRCKKLQALHSLRSPPLLLYTYSRCHCSTSTFSPWMLLQRRLESGASLSRFPCLCGNFSLFASENLLYSISTKLLLSSREKRFSLKIFLRRLRSLLKKTFICYLF